MGRVSWAHLTEWGTAGASTLKPSIRTHRSEVQAHDSYKFRFLFSYAGSMMRGLSYPRGPKSYGTGWTTNDQSCHADKYVLYNASCEEYGRLKGGEPWCLKETVRDFFPAECLVPLSNTPYENSLHCLVALGSGCGLVPGTAHPSSPMITAV